MRLYINSGLHKGFWPGCFHIEEEIFLTEEVLRSSCMIGTAPELIDRLRALEAAGLDQVMNLPNLDTKLQVLEDVARELIPTLQS